MLHHSSLNWVNADTAGIARAVGIKQRALGGPRPRPQLATAPFGLAPSAPARGHQGPRGLGHGGADVSQELSMRILTHGPRDTLDTTATLGACLDQEQLRHLVPGEAIGRRHQHTCQGGHRGPVSASVQTGTLEGGATIAVIALDGLVCTMPSRVERHGGVQAAAWWRNRLMLWRTPGRDTHVESNVHGIPPDDAMAQGYGLRAVPSPIAAGPGMPNPTVVHHHVVLGLSGVHASLCACVPPAYVKYRTQEDTPTTGSAAEP